MLLLGFGVGICHSEIAVPKIGSVTVVDNDGMAEPMHRVRPDCRLSITGRAYGARLLTERHPAAEPPPLPPVWHADRSLFCGAKLRRADIGCNVDKIAASQMRLSSASAT